MSSPRFLAICVILLFLFMNMAVAVCCPQMCGGCPGDCPPEQCDPPAGSCGGGEDCVDGFSKNG